MGGDSSLVGLEGEHRFDRTRMAVILTKTWDQAPSRTNNGNSLVEHPWEGCNLDSATALEVAFRHPAPVGEQQRSLRWWTIS